MKFFQIVFFGLSAFALNAQPKLNSPYSRYGIGDFLPQYSAFFGGMGGTTTAQHDLYHLNMQNPASLAYLRTTAFETGLYGKYSNYKASNDQLKAGSGNISHLALGFTLKSPINEVLDRKKTPWHYGMGFSLSPYATVGYFVRTTNFTAGVDSTINVYQGNGGAYRFNWATAAKYKNTSAGISLGWQFGKASYENTTQFVDTLPTYLNNFRDELVINGLLWSLGLQHDLVLAHEEKDKDIATKWVTFGLTAESSHRLNATATQLRIRSRSVDPNGIYSSPDTIGYTPNQKSKVTLPGRISVGIQYVNNQKFKAGLQYTRENWSVYKNETRPENFRNTNALALGFEIIPDFQSYNKYSRRIRYRFGGYYRQDPRVVNGKNLDDLGLTIGLGLPLIMPRQGTSFINAALELGKLGADSPISETYARLTLGFTLNDNSWFYQRRFE